MSLIKYLCTYLSISICLSVYLSVLIYLSLYVSLFIFLSLHLSLFVSLSFCRPLSLCSVEWLMQMWKKGRSIVFRLRMTLKEKQHQKIFPLFSTWLLNALIKLPNPIHPLLTLPPVIGISSTLSLSHYEQFW